MLQQMAEAILIHMAEVGAQQARLGSVNTQALDHPIGRRLPQQHTQGGTTSRQGVADLPQKVVVEAKVADKVKTVAKKKMSAPKN